MKSQHFLQKVITYPITRILLGLLICLAAFILAQQVVELLLPHTGAGKELRNLIKGIFASISVIIAYRVFFQYVEARAITELSAMNIIANLLLGLSLGITLQCLTILVIYLNNGFKIISINPVSSMVIPMTVAFTVAIFEEILIRGIIFRIIEEKLGSYIALFVSALIFGGLHLANPNATIFSASAVAIEAGLLFGAAYIYSRSLWLPIAIHFAWNFMQSGVFGGVTSGNENSSSLLTTQITGIELITGGKFGPEGTVQAMFFCLTATAFFMYLNMRRAKLIKLSLA